MSFGSDLTYEGLKPDSKQGVGANVPTRSDLTYEGLKQFAQYTEFVQRPLGSDLTYEGLKPRKIAS